MALVSCLSQSRRGHATWVIKQLQAAGKDYTIHVYPDANHGLFDVPSTDPRAMPDTLQWLRQHT